MCASFDCGWLLVQRADWGRFGAAMHRAERLCLIADEVARRVERLCLLMDKTSVNYYRASVYCRKIQLLTINMLNFDF